MDMFTLTRSSDRWVACCRACGHEQTLPDDDRLADAAQGYEIQCERCPGRETYLSMPPPTTAEPTTLGY
ncbi:hypothetical protein [Salinicola avicenniae]|uniref:hypothetical protein n=1 Tax=Salinicola avicenniae TaxID=2916836 RepID=UPI00207359AB|nr:MULTISPECIES: hypothetical protein [unclassified Salinicola]